MDLSMPAGMPASSPEGPSSSDPQSPPTAAFTTPAAFEDQDACGICGCWTCRCTTSTHRRLVAAGITRHTPGRTTRVLITQAGVTGSIRPAVTR